MARESQQVRRLECHERCYPVDATSTTKSDNIRPVSRATFLFQLLGRYLWRGNTTAQGASMPLTRAGPKWRSGGSAIHQDWSRTREISSEMIGFSIRHSGGEPQRTAGTKDAQSHPQATYEPSTWEERATHKPPPCDLHATYMRPTCDHQATLEPPGGDYRWSIADAQR